MALPEPERGLNGAGISQGATVAARGAIGIALNQAKALEVLQHGGNDLGRSSETRCQGLSLERAAMPNLI